MRIIFTFVCAFGMLTLMDKKLLGQKIEMLRKGVGYSQTALAERIDASRATISNVENGTQSISLELFVKLCGALNIPSSELLRGVTASAHENPNSTAARTADELKIKENILSNIYEGWK